MKFSGKIAFTMTMTQNSEKLENVAMVTLKSGIADFQAQFHCERLVSDQQIAKQWMSNRVTMFSKDRP